MPRLLSTSQTKSFVCTRGWRALASHAKLWLTVATSVLSELVERARTSNQDPTDMGTCTCAWKASRATALEFRNYYSGTNCRHTLRIALPLSSRKFAIVLKCGAKHCVNHISSTLRCDSRSSRRLD